MTTRNHRGGESRCPRCAALRLIAAAAALTAAASAQSVPASVITINQPTSGQAIFDAAGNTYYLSGPVTPGAAQMQTSVGTCYVATGFIGSIPTPCGAVQVAKVNPAGNEVWGTLLGGETNDIATALAVDAAGNVFVTGSTGGQFDTTSGAAIPTSTTATAFAAEISADGSKFLYSTYLPPGPATASAIALDAQDNVYIAGKTSAGHAFVVKLSASGSTILYNVTLAGSGLDAATAIVIDSAGNALVAGETTSANFLVTAGALQTQLAGEQNIFLAKLDPSGNVLMSTYLGGSGVDSPAAIALDGAGNTYIAGSTSSLDFPTTAGTMQPSPIVPAWNNTSPAGFVAQISPNESKLSWASYVMSSDIALVAGVGELAVTASGDVYLGGITGPGFPVTPSAPQICFAGSNNSDDGFVAHLNSQGSLVDATYIGPIIGVDVNAVWGLMPQANGQVSVVWHDAGNNRLSTLQFGTGGWTAPACLSTDVVNAATQSGNGGGNGGIAPAELVTLTGFGIGPDAGVSYQPDSQGNVPTQTGGVQVRFDGAPAPVLYAQSRQINTIAPAGLTIGATTNVTVTYNNQQFDPATASVTFGSAGIFRLHVGQSSQAVAMNQDWTLNGPTNPATRGSIVTVWATGYGETSPACTVGGLNDPVAEPLNPGTSALIFSVAPTIAQYAGSAPTLVCGIVQINFQIPTNIAPGVWGFDPWVQLVNGNATETLEPPIGATIFVK